MTSSNGNISRAAGHLCWEFTGRRCFPTQRPVTGSFDVSLICAWINVWVKKSWGWWFETPSRSLSSRCDIFDNKHTPSGSLCWHHINPTAPSWTVYADLLHRDFLPIKSNWWYPSLVLVNGSVSWHLMSQSAIVLHNSISTCHENIGRLYSMLGHDTNTSILYEFARDQNC